MMRSGRREMDQELNPEEEAEWLGSKASKSQRTRRRKMVAVTLRAESCKRSSVG